MSRHATPLYRPLLSDVVDRSFPPSSDLNQWCNILMIIDNFLEQFEPGGVLCHPATALRGHVQATQEQEQQAHQALEAAVKNLKAAQKHKQWFHDPHGAAQLVSEMNITHFTAPAAGHPLATHRGIVNRDLPPPSDWEGWSKLVTVLKEFVGMFDKGSFLFSDSKELQESLADAKKTIDNARREVDQARSEREWLPCPAKLASGLNTVLQHQGQHQPRDPIARLVYIDRVALLEFIKVALKRTEQAMATHAVDGQASDVYKSLQLSLEALRNAVLPAATVWHLILAVWEPSKIDAGAVLARDRGIPHAVVGADLIPGRSRGHTHSHSVSHGGETADRLRELGTALV
ncbi:hypothetical protein OIO90_005180 [Microbotryomycetes sp. JL221]|nr:hypothetical protein OIO90_005180 [Microbotryomycetes sp. JL221]